MKPENATVAGNNNSEAPQGQPMDDVLPGTKPPPTIVFVDSPEDIEAALNSSVLLACRTAEPVSECQWSWQALPPTTLPLPELDRNSSDANSS